MAVLLRQLIQPWQPTELVADSLCKAESRHISSDLGQKQAKLAQGEWGLADRHLPPTANNEE